MASGEESTLVKHKEVTSNVVQAGHRGAGSDQGSGAS